MNEKTFLPHQQRVIDEASELTVKVEKLQFFFENDIFINLPQEDKSLLMAQHGSMVSYLNILSLRINKF